MQRTLDDEQHWLLQMAVTHPPHGILGSTPRSSTKNYVERKPDPSSALQGIKATITLVKTGQRNRRKIDQRNRLVTDHKRGHGEIGKPGPLKILRRGSLLLANVGTNYPDEL